MGKLGVIMSVTLKDVAEKAKINAGSVSQVLNGHPKANELKKETRERIIRVARQLGYCRNDLASSVRRGINRTIGVVVDFKNNSHHMDAYSSRIILGLLDEADRNNYAIRLLDGKNVEKVINILQSNRIEKVIVMSINQKTRKKFAEFCRSQKMSLVFLREQPASGYYSVNSADRQDARTSVSILAGHGHRNIALLCGPLEYFYAREHYAGYLEGLKDSGLDCPNALISCQTNINESESDIERMLSLPVSQRPTAFYCIADSLAMKVQNVAIQRGLNIPGDISIISVGDMDFCEFLSSPLSSMHQQHEQMGAYAVRICLGLPNKSKPSPDNIYFLPSKLIIRSSFGKLNK